MWIVKLGWGWYIRKCFWNSLHILTANTKWKALTKNRIIWYLCCRTEIQSACLLTQDACQSLWLLKCLLSALIKELLELNSTFGGFNLVPKKTERYVLVHNKCVCIKQMYDSLYIWNILILITVYWSSSIYEKGYLVYILFVYELHFSFEVSLIRSYKSLLLITTGAKRS